MQVHVIPAVTVLIATYNRAALLPRAVDSVLKQTFRDFEIVIIDDCSTDNTQDVASGFSDPRIRYFRNPENQGAKLGDREHVRRTVHSLMRGRYFIYLCDDDYWLPDDLLERQIAAFTQFPNLAMAVGGHAHTYDRDMTMFARSFVRVPGASEFTVRSPGALPSGLMSSAEYLTLFAAEPLYRNFLDGGTLFLREAFIKANVFGSPDGSRWQAGYEFKIGPALMGDVFYIDEACVIAGVDAGNASFRGTQFEHYLDCVKGVEIAFRNAWPALNPETRRRMMPIERTFIRNITTGFLGNRLAWNIGGFDTNPIDHAHMFTDNLTAREVAKVYLRHRMIPSMWESQALFVSSFGERARTSPFLREATQMLLRGASFILLRAPIAHIPDHLFPRLRPFIAWRMGHLKALKGHWIAVSKRIAHIPDHLFPRLRPFIAWRTGHLKALKGHWIAVSKRIALRGIMALGLRTTVRRLTGR